MRDSLKKRLFAPLVQHFSHFMQSFALVPKKNNRFTVLVWNFVNFARKFRLRSLTKVDQNE